MGPGSASAWDERRDLAAALLLAGAAAAASAFVGHRAFGGVPHVADGVAYAFQGRIFASGQPWLPPPPVAEAFQSQNVLLNATRWCGIYPPGFPALLAAGWLLGAPALVNPVLLGLAVLGVFRLGATLFGRGTGLLGALLLAVSPFALLMSGGFMGHVAALSVFTWTLVFLARAASDEGARPLLLAGLLGGFGVVVRPQAAVFFLAPAVLALLAVRRRAPARTAALLAAGAALPLGLLLAYNFALSGHPLRMAYLVWDPNLSFTGNFTAAHLFATHFPWFLHDLDATVWGFPWGDVLPLLLLLVPAPKRLADAALGASVLGLLAAFSCYQFYEINHSGPRYAFEALGALALLLARALLTAGGLGRRVLGRIGAGRVAAVAGAAAVCLLAALPLARLLPRQAEALSHQYHAHLNEPFRGLAEAGVGRSALVLVAGNTAEWTYGSFLLANGTDPRTAPRVFARDLPEKRAALAAAYPRDETWRVTVTLKPLPHPNAWIDNTWDLVDVVWTRLR